MSIFKTSTPDYRRAGTTPGSSPARSTGLWSWLASLFRTPTPSYQARVDADNGDSSAGSDLDVTTDITTTTREHEPAATA